MSADPYLIIGGTKGIGRRLAEILIASGHPVITVARGEAAPAGVVDHVVADAVTGELPADRLPMALAGMAYCPGSIDLKPLRSLRPDDLRQAFEVNVVGAFRAAQVCAERLKRNPGAGIVLFSTVAVKRGMPFHASIAAAKGAVEGLTRSLAAELAPHVRVNCIAPSLTRTPLAGKLLGAPEREQTAAERHPLKRVGEADDVAALASHLLLPTGGWITGQVIGVDGGLGSL